MARHAPQCRLRAGLLCLLSGICAFVCSKWDSSFIVHTAQYGRGSMQSGDFVKPNSDKPKGVVMLIHGGFWKAGFDRSLMIDISDDLLGSGLCVWNVDYRSVGSGGGYPSTLEDVASAFNWLGSDEAVSLGVHPNLPVGIVGHSAGGHLAAWLAIQGLLDRSDFDLSSDIKPRIVVAQAGVLDLKGAYEANLGRSAVRDFMGTPPASAASRMLAASNGAVLDVVASPADDADLRYSRADPTELLRKVSAARLTSGAPVFALVHGQGDDIVPTAQSVAFQSALRQCNGSDQCICNLIRGEGHFEHLRPDSAAWASTAHLLKTQLASSGT